MNNSKRYNSTKINNKAIHQIDCMNLIEEIQCVINVIDLLIEKIKKN